MPAMARFITAHPNPWGWNPFQYCGLPTQFLYVPLLPYLTAAVARLAAGARARVRLPADHRRARRASGPSTLFFFVLHFTGSRRWALAAALAYTVFSPAYGLFPAGREGPRDRAASLAHPGPREVRRGSAQRRTRAPAGRAAGASGAPANSAAIRAIFAAAILLAAIPLTNWLSAFALAIASGLLLFAAWGEPGFRLWRPLAAAGLAWLLACFWLTPASSRRSRSTGRPIPSATTSGRSSAGCSWRSPPRLIADPLRLRRLGASFYFCFVTLCAFTFGWFATAYYVYGVDTIPESRRYALEFELFLILAVAEALRLALAQQGPDGAPVRLRLGRRDAAGRACRSCGAI